MKFNPDIHHRRSIRLSGYDYSQEGLYFITLCAENRLHLFGEVENDVMIKNAAGHVAERCILAIPDHFLNTKLHGFVVMPNHVHFIIEIVVKANVGANNHSPLQRQRHQSSPKSSHTIRANNHSPLQPVSSTHTTSPRHPHGTSKTIGSIVRGFKIGVTKWFRENSDIQTVWLRNYYEHVIRNEKSYLHISEYIQGNPATWRDDRYFE